MKLEYESENIIQVKKYLKEQVRDLMLNLYEAERGLITSLFEEGSFGNNALLIGAPKSGKTTVRKSRKLRDFCIEAILLSAGEFGSQDTAEKGKVSRGYYHNIIERICSYRR